MGFQDFRAGGRASAADVGRVSRAPADRSNVGFSLRDSVEPAGQPVEGRAVYGRDEAGEEEAGSGICAGAGGRRLYGERAAGGFAAAGSAVYVRARWRAAGGRARRAIAADRGASLWGGERGRG